MLGRIIYKLFKPIFLKHYFLDQSKKSGFENMEKVFIDSNGKAYYRPINDFDLPHERTKELEKKIMRLKAGLSEEEMDLILDAMEKALNSGKKSELAVIGHCIIEIRKRKEILIHPDMMMDIAALRYIREDEDPSKIDAGIHKDKIAQFKKDSSGGLYDFFYKAGFSQIIPYLSKLEKDWNEYMMESEIKIKALNQHLQAYITK